jgi:hypothetical protein
MRKRVSNHVRHLREDLPDVQRLAMVWSRRTSASIRSRRATPASGSCHQATARDDIADRFEQLVMFIAERIRRHSMSARWRPAHARPA